MKRLSLQKISLIAMLSVLGLTACSSESTTSHANSSNQSDSKVSNSNGSDSAVSDGKASSDSGEAEKPEESKVDMINVSALRLIDAQSGWAGGEGWIARTEDEGANWKVQYSGIGKVNQIFALNGNDAWAVLSDSTLLSTSDGGNHWSEIGKAPNQGFIHFMSNSIGFCANMKTTDGGKTWTKLAIPDQAIGDAYFHDESNGWVVSKNNQSYRIEKTSDGGNTWSVVFERDGQTPNGAVIRSAGPKDAWVELVGDSGMTQTSYSLFHTEDGGENWLPVLANATAGGGPAPGIRSEQTEVPKNDGASPGSLYVASPKVAFMGGQCMACPHPNTMGWTTDGGRTWNNGKQEFDGFGPQLLAIADKEHGWFISTDNREASVMYVTSDGGKNWTKVHAFDSQAH